MLVKEFVDGYNNLKKPELKREFCEKHLTKTYASIVDKNAALKNFANGCVINNNGVPYLDMVANKINMTWAIVFLYTDLQLDVLEDKKQDVIGLYDKFQEYGIINMFCEIIGEREINELLMVNKEVINTWHEEHTSTRAFINSLVDGAVRTFAEVSVLMQETITDEDRQKLSETIKGFVGISK